MWRFHPLWNCGNCARPKTLHRRYTGDILPWQLLILRFGNGQILGRSSKKETWHPYLQKAVFFHAFAVSDGPKSRAVGTVSWFFTLILSSACRKFWKWWINNRNWSNGITEGFSTNDPGLSVRWDGQPLDEAFWPWFVVRSWGMVSL